MPMISGSSRLNTVFRRFLRVLCAFLFYFLSDFCAFCVICTHFLT